MNERPEEPRPWPQLQPETLWPRTVLTSRDALASGALQPIATECQIVAHGEVPFQVRVLGRAHLKKLGKWEQSSTAPPVDPFTRPEPALVVGDLTPTHLCLLNKYNAVDHHLLIITRAFEEQESPLSAADFEALALCMAGLDGLAFYNSGETAGASQRHKHLQLIPPLGPGDLAAPMERLLSPLPAPGSLAKVPALRFVHAATGLALHGTPPVDAAARMTEAYAMLRDALGFGPHGPPYNLLATRRWMLLVPRTHAACQGIEINSLGFAGALLVRTPEQLQLVRAMGPLELLRQVAVPLPA